MKRWFCVVVSLVMFWCAEAQDPGRYDVVLHEIFADPTPSRGLPASEFIEIRNRSTQSINLRNWSIKTGSSIGRINVNYVLPPDSMVILCSSAAASSFQAFGPTVVVSSFPSLNNDGDSLILISASGRIIHGLLWRSSWYQNTLKEEGGWSLEMKDIQFPCESNQNWGASIDPKGGTPGKTNSIREKIKEPDKPTLLYSYILGRQDLFLEFSKPIDLGLGTAQISPAIPFTKLDEVGPLHTSLRIRLQAPADTATMYMVTVKDLKTCQGGILPEMRKRSGVLQAPEANKILINEILFNPAPGGSDFVELFNRSAQVLNIQQLMLANRNTAGLISSINKIVSTPYPIFPGEHVAISADPNWIKNKYLPPDTVSMIQTTLPSYPNDKGAVVLLDDQGKIIDELNYDDKWHFSLISNTEGISLERLNPAAATQQSSNWHSGSGSSGYGTPGYRNAQTSNQQVSSTFISLNTKIISPDNDGRDDYLMIQYSFPDPGRVITIRVYDVAGREILKIANNILCGTSGQFKWDGFDLTGKAVHKGFYVLYAEAFNTKGEVSKFKASVAVYGN